jgi:hypothetical protein
MLERYCQEFQRRERVKLVKGKNIFAHGYDNDTKGIYVTYDNDNDVGSVYMEKSADYTGLRLDIPPHNTDSYVVSYTISVVSGVLWRIGGHNAHFEPEYYSITDEHGAPVSWTWGTNDSYVVLDEPISRGASYNVEISYKRRPSNGTQDELYVQPNRGMNNDTIKCNLSNF